MEHTSELVSDGKLIHENSYEQRSDKFQEVEVEGIKIDYFDAKNKVIHETKRSDAMEEAHEWQLKYYIYSLEKKGLEGIRGILEYPKLRVRKEILLGESDKENLEKIIPEIHQIIHSSHCPDKIKMKLCKKCSYFDFCWSGEE